MRLGSNFRTQSHDNRKTQLCHALTCHSHAHSISQRLLNRPSVGALHHDVFLNDFYFHFSSRTDSKQLQESPIFTPEKIVSITCTNPVLTGPMRYCNYRDITSVNLRKFPFILRPGNKANLQHACLLPPLRIILTIISAGRKNDPWKDILCR